MTWKLKGCPAETALFFRYAYKNEGLFLEFTMV
jgi:hypothetical protein